MEAASEEPIEVSPNGRYVKVFAEIVVCQKYKSSLEPQTPV